jgi:hypothetical protein
MRFAVPLVANAQIRNGVTPLGQRAVAPAQNQQNANQPAADAPDRKH